MGGSHNARFQKIRVGQAAGVASLSGPAHDRPPAGGSRPLREACRAAAGHPGTRKEKGAVAVEFALVLPVFLMLVLGIFEFGRAFNIQVSLSEAARESARYAAVRSAEAGFTVDAAQGAGVAAAPTVPLVKSDVAVSYRNPDGTAAGSCGTNVDVLSTVTYSTGFLTGLEQLIGVSQPFTVRGKGVMRCGG